MKIIRGGASAGGGGGDVEITGNAPISVEETAPGVFEVSFNELHALATFTNDVNIFEFGDTIDEVNFAWTYNRNGDDPQDQDINGGVGDIANALRVATLNPAALSNTTTWTLTATGDDGNVSSLQTTATEMAKVYSGVDQAIINTGAGIMAEFSASGAFDANRQHTYTFDASVGGGENYLYIAYPVSYGPVAGLPNMTFNGFAFNDMTRVDDSLTNAVGGIQDYIILRSNQVYSGADITIVVS